METNQNPPGKIPVVTPPSSWPRRKPGKWMIAVVLLVIIGVSSTLLIRSGNQQDIAAEPNDALVEISNVAFTPGLVKIKKGNSVTWINTDKKPHKIEVDMTTKALPELTSGEELAQNATYTFTFKEAGTYTYYDPLNPTALKGTVIVEE